MLVPRGVMTSIVVEPNAVAGGIGREMELSLVTVKPEVMVCEPMRTAVALKKPDPDNDTTPGAKAVTFGGLIEFRIGCVGTTVRQLRD